MDIKEILKRCDHTLLTQSATEKDILSVVDDGIKYSTASVCIPPCYVKAAAEYSGGRIPICTVIGFPNGNSTTDSKVYETECALRDGADEIDMVINIGMLRSGGYSYVLDEINRIKACAGDKILKVIVECSLLTEDEKAKICNIVLESNADYIKTSTGFAGGGATREDVKLFASIMKGGKKIKAAGGISSLSDAEDFIKLGADRLGTSRIVKLVKKEEGSGY
jgi:deoxyribose-phosphate aldolase